MPDPEMVSRAHRAAATLERAWERWRIRHGLTMEPMPPVSSYVGYSIGEPWGRPRVVFGVDAREAEVLAALLDSHEYTGLGAGQEPGPAGRAIEDVRARIPAQMPAVEGTTGRELPTGGWNAAMAGPAAPLGGRDGATPGPVPPAGGQAPDSGLAAPDQRAWADDQPWADAAAWPDNAASPDDAWPGEAWPGEAWPGKAWPGEASPADPAPP